MNTSSIFNIVMGIIVATISGILVPPCRRFFVKILKFFSNKFNQWKSILLILLLSKKFKKKLKLIVNGLSDCLDDKKTCSLIYLIKNIQNLYSLQTRLLVSAINETNFGKELEKVQKERIVSSAVDEASLLRDWYTFYKGRIDSVSSFYISELFNEFGFILSRIQRIFEKVIRTLDEESIQNIKIDSYSYPLFKQIFVNTATEFNKLTQEASGKLKGIRVWPIVVLPEL